MFQFLNSGFPTLVNYSRCQIHENSGEFHFNTFLILDKIVSFSLRKCETPVRLLLLLLCKKDNDRLARPPPTPPSFGPFPHAKCTSRLPTISQIHTTMCSRMVTQLFIFYYQQKFLISGTKILQIQSSRRQKTSNYKKFKRLPMLLD